MRNLAGKVLFLFIFLLAVSGGIAFDMYSKRWLLGYVSPTEALSDPVFWLYILPPIAIVGFLFVFVEQRVLQRYVNLSGGKQLSDWADWPFFSGR